MLVLNRPIQPSLALLTSSHTQNPSLQFFSWFQGWLMSCSASVRSSTIQHTFGSSSFFPCYTWNASWAKSMAKHSWPLSSLWCPGFALLIIRWITSGQQIDHILGAMVGMWPSKSYMGKLISNALMLVGGARWKIIKQSLHKWRAMLPCEDWVSDRTSKLL